MKARREWRKKRERWRKDQRQRKKDKKIRRKSPSVAVELKEDSEVGKVLPRWRLGQLIFGIAAGECEEASRG